jgi:CHASE2 domain-containing sensor protein
VRLSLEREVAEIRTTLQLSANRDRFKIDARGAVRANELQQYFYDLKPQIVHFSGHGVGGATSSDEPLSDRKFTAISNANSQPEGLMFEDENGRSILVSGKVLSNLFGLFSKEVECVVLNSCYSLVQAQEICKHIPYVVGMNQAIGDIAARQFSQGFYRAIWDDRSIEEAFESGKNAIELDGIPEELTPVLLKRSNLSLIKPPRSFKFSQQPVLVRQMLLAIATSIGTTLLIMGVRHLGLLQVWELTAFDTLMRSRPLEEKPDPRLLIVKVTEKDVQAQKQAGEDLGGGSLSDRSLAKIIAKLQSYQPSAIGIDIYRDAPVSTDLAAKLQDSAIPIFTICKVREEGKTRGVAPPPNITFDLMSVGFSDVPKDIDGAIRRHQLFFNTSSISDPRCQAQYGLSTLLALHYLNTKGVNFTPIPALNDWQGVKLGSLSFSLLPDRSEAHVGAYQKITTAGQIVLNYRAMKDPNDIAPPEKMATLLAGEIPADKIKGRIVLIGTTAQSYNDYHPTPYRTADSYVLEIPGIVLQAQMVSQLISAVEDKRPLIQIGTGWMDALWIWSWAVGGGLLVVWLHRRPAYLGLATGLGIGILSGGSLMLLVNGYWVALIPAAIAIVITESITLLVLKLRAA